MDSTAKLSNKALLLWFIGGVAIGVVSGIILQRLFPSTSSGNTTTASTGGQVTTTPTATVTTTQPTA